MSVPKYISEPYITLDDALLHIGYTPDKIKAMSDQLRTQYINWTTESNNRVESDLFPFSDVTPLVKGTKEYTFAKSAALNWFVYKKRDREGSKNASAAKKDYEDDIEKVKQLLSRTPTLRMDPTGTLTSDSTADIIIPYSQSQGFSPGIIW